MKTIIAGSREVTSYHEVKQAIEKSEFDITQVVSGCARGVDRLGEKFAADYNIPCVKFPADWNTHGKRAGYLRNQQMADYADALIAIWDGESRGTKHMIDIATKAGLAVYVYKYNNKGE